MAAIKAADEGVRSLILESMPRPARKLGISGKGRGNLTNTAPYKDFLKHFNNDGRFLKFAFKQFFNNDLIDFFTHEGLETVVERGGRVFSASGKAPEIVGALVRAAEKRGVKILTNTPVTQISKQNNLFQVSAGKGQVFSSEFLIIATGGKSYPLTGSTGDGYKFAQAMGHRITPLHPALVALKPIQDLPTDLDQLLLKNVSVSLWNDNRKIANEFGELSFLDGFLAGPTIITLSRIAVPLLSQGAKISVKIDLKPALDHEKLEQRLLRDLQKLNRAPLEKLLPGLLPNPMARFCQQSLAIDPMQKCCDFSADKRRKLRNWLKEANFDIKEAGPWSQAIVTAGGIEANEINQQTMESKLVKNLYFAGEVIDIDADTGGYNLQAAFSTGWLAGNSAAHCIKSDRI